MAEYRFGSILDRSFRTQLQKMADEVNEYGKSIQDLVAEGQLTEEQYGNLINTVNGMLKSGEVGEYDLTPELRAEVDKVKNKIDKGEVSIYDINKNKGKFDQTYLTQDLIDAITGAPGANVLSDVAPRVITEDKLADDSVGHRALADVKMGKNLFDKNKTVPNHRPQANTGEIIPHETYHASNFIAINPGETVTVSHVYYRAYYDKGMNHVGGDGSTASKTFTMPQDAFYVCFAAHETVLDTFQVEIGDEQTDYEPFELIIDGLSAKNLNLAPDAILPGSNSTIQESKALVMNTDTRTAEIIRENGKVSQIQEKDGDAVIKTTEIIYSTNGTVVQVNEIANGKKIVYGIQRTDGQISQILKGVQNV